MSRKYADSEKYFSITQQMIGDVTKNPVNIYQANKNLLLLYTYSDLGKAVDLSDKLMQDSEEYLPVHNKELTFMSANI